MPLWPVPIPVVGLTGPVNSGKTLFGMLIDPAHTLLYDEEKSSASYESLGVTRIDLHQELQKFYPRGYRPMQAFEWWLADIRKQVAGKYTVIMTDTVGLLENGLVDWVEANPQFFGHTPSQHKAQNGAMKWGDVSKYWKLVLLDIASKCETFVFTSHMTDIRKDGESTGKFKPKGNKVLMEIASLYLEMERKADARGNVPEKPSAKVLKQRLISAPTVDPVTGELTVKRILPPHMPVATPHSIRGYFAKPVGDTLAAGELATEERLSEDERLQLQVQKAQAEAEAERLRSEREQMRSRGSVNHSVAPAPVTPPVVAAPAAPPIPTGPTDAQIETLVSLRSLMFAAKGLADEAEQDAAWAAVLEPAGVKSVRELSTEDVDQLIEALRAKYDFPTFGASAPAAAPIPDSSTPPPVEIAASGTPS